ncbi:MAG TPA: lysylphosphatidylglycerol synthase transmembrane domain-containing protein [Ktedonobacteraceae bacterium]|nr:lysylphosphatidylglycerol synthase transmembrane domain-containing protein [Ktedonobacteraceae bacterium]
MRPPGENLSEREVIRPTRLIKNPHPFLNTDKLRRYRKPTADEVEAQPTVLLPATPATPRPSAWESMPTGDPDADIPFDMFDVGSMSTVRLMAVSGMMRAVRPATQPGGNGAAAAISAQPTIPHRPPWAGPPVMSNSYQGAVLTPPTVPVTPAIIPQQEQRTWKTILNKPLVRTLLGLLFGLGMLFLISKFVNIPSTIATLRQQLTTTRGVTFVLLAAASFIAAFSVRGARWRLFLLRICDISLFKSIQIFWVAVFLNFLLPVQGGELGKCLILKRTKHVPISQSLPTVAMDKSLDLMPALFIMAAVPFIPGIHMSATLWIILGIVGGILLGIIFTVALMAWNRVTATKFIRMMLRILPRGIGGKIEGFALGFVDSLLDGASRPKTFIPAILLTCLAITCDGLFAWFAFQAVGVTTISFGTAIFGYTTYNMFCILPTPPGQVGSNELVGVLVFGSLLGYPKTQVLAMYLLSHPLAALIMTTMCLICLSGLGISLKGAIKINTQKSGGSQAA